MDVHVTNLEFFEHVSRSGLHSLHEDKSSSQAPKKYNKLLTHVSNVEINHNYHATSFRHTHIFNP